MKSARLVFPRKYIFGEGVLERALTDLNFLGDKAVVITGRRWARESGILDKVLNILKSAEIDAVALSGISPNPNCVEIDEKAKRVKEIDPDFVAALGGGSVMDATKAISLVAKSGGSIWEYVEKRPKGIKAYPVVAIPTVAASGSEMDGAAVVNNRALKTKMPVSYPELVPVVSIVDPSLHTSLPKYETAIGCVDIFCQFFEPYLLGEGNFSVSEDLSLLGMKSVIDLSQKVLKEPKDVRIRGELAMLASLSMSSWGRVGRGGKFSLHWLEHILSGYYPDIPHAQGLASLLVPFVEFHITRKPELFEKVAAYLTGKGEPKEFVGFLRNWLKELGVLKSLNDLGVKEGDLEDMADDVVRYYGSDVNGLVPGPVPMDSTIILTIYRSSFDFS